ncbi:MAG: CRISPR-associated protein Cas4 [Deltaproteobacteria bacterium]|nr:CRISPR-associated protein Cas4 [Deltaproteobacteria bacterium]
MTYPESDLVPLSALQHWLFCPRQCALIHLEQVWEENRLTAEGRVLHERVDAGGAEKRRDVKRAFGLPIRCLRLGLTGKADVVEFHRHAAPAPSVGPAALAPPRRSPDGSWQPYPVEHKRGRRKREDWDRVQLCAQALCLEEMLGVSIPEAALFYGSEQRREVVALDEALRRETEETAAAVHQMLLEGRTPPPEYAKKCESCSLVEVCLPKTAGPGRGGRVARYLARAVAEASVSAGEGASG